MRVALITGATSGIGQATALYLAERGWHIIGTGLADDDFRSLAHPNIRHHPLDMTHEASVTALAQAIPHLDVLINNAGINLPSPIEELAISTLRQQFAVNVEGHLRVTQAFLPQLRATRGRIVMLSSLMGKVPMPLLGAYSMSKHALEAMADVLRLELAPDGIAVSIVAMGAIATPMTEGMASSLNRAKRADTRYEWLYEAMTRALVQQQRGAVAPQRVAQVIEQAITARQPRPRYVVDTPAWGLTLMRRLAPLDIADGILARALGLRQKR